MSALTLFPLQYKRQGDVPVDIDMTFATTAERMVYLSNARRYAGMLVVDNEEEKCYLLNSARDAWIAVGSAQLTVQDEGVALGSTPTTVINIVGDSVAATSADDGATVNVTVAPSLHVQDEGTPVGALTTKTMNFVGSGVSATTSNDGETVTVSVSGGGSGNGELFIFQVGTPSPTGYTTYFGEDLNTNPTPEADAVTSTPNSDAARALFLTGLTGTSTQDFETSTVGDANGLVLNYPSSLTATMSGTAIEIVALDGSTETDGFGRYSIPALTSFRFLLAEAGTDFTITFNQDISAFGFNATDIGDFAGTLEIVLLNASSVEVGRIPLSGVNATAGGSVLYFGAVSQGVGYDFRSIRFESTAGSGDVFGFDNFTIARRTQLVSPPSLHLHYATLSSTQAASMIAGTDISLPVASVGQPSVTLTTSAAGSGPHTHVITVFYDYELHKFIVTNVATNHSGSMAHEGNVVGDGPVRYNSTIDAIEYYSTEQAGYIDIAMPKVRTKTTHYTLTPKDNQYIFRMNSASPINLIIPHNDDVNIPVGFTAVLSMNGSGATSFYASAGVTILSPSTLTIAMLYGKASITKTGTNLWEVEGNIGGSVTLDSSGAPMGGFRAYTNTVATMTSGSNVFNLNAAFTSGNGYWYGQMSPDQPSQDWSHVKVVGGQLTLNSTGTFWIVASCEIEIDHSVIPTSTMPSVISLELIDGLGNLLSAGSVDMLKKGGGDSFFLLPKTGVTLAGWVHNDGVSGPLGGNQTVQLRLQNPYSGSVSVSSLDVCFSYADTRQPRQFSA